MSEALDNNIHQYIDDLVKNNKIILFMKGNATAPMCGFSAMVVKILSIMNVEFKDINVLEDPELRQAIKDYTNWPTIPQLYVNGEFIGGCDIVKELYDNNELSDILNK